MVSEKYDKSKKMYISLRDIEQQFNWLADWNGFLWYIADHARIINVDNKSCVLEIVSRVHEYHVMKAVKNYVPKPLKEEIRQSLESGIGHKMAEANRNKPIVVQIFFQGIQDFQWFAELFPNRSIIPDVFGESWLLETFLSKLKAFPSNTEIEEKYPQTFVLPEYVIDNISKTGEYPCVHPPIAKGRILLPNHTVLLFQAKESVDGLAITLIKLICIDNSAIWCATYKASWFEGCCRLKYADNYPFRIYCAKNQIKVPQATYSTKVQTANREYISSMMHNSCYELELFCETMKFISNQQKSKKIGEQEREDKSWYVRGHWRTLQSGRRVYVHPHTKGVKK